MNRTSWSACRVSVPQASRATHGDASRCCCCLALHRHVWPPADRTLAQLCDPIDFYKTFTFIQSAS